MGSTLPAVPATRTSDPAAQRALSEISAQWVGGRDPRGVTTPTNSPTEAMPGTGAPRSVDPRGAPYIDPAPPNYRFPSRPVVDHIHNRARGGHATAAANLDTKTWEANSRKAGFEGNYSRDLQRYMQLGLTGPEAEYVLQGEHDYIMTDVHARPIDPDGLDNLPNQPEEGAEEDEDA